MYGAHGVWSLAQSSEELEVEDSTDQTADTAGGKEDHLGDKKVEGDADVLV